MGVKTSPGQREHPGDPSSPGFPRPIPLLCEADLINPLRRVRDCIDPRAVLLSVATPLVEALRILKRSETGAVPTIERRRPAGFLTDRNVIAAIYDRPRDWETLTVGDLVEQGPLPARADDRLDAIFARFHRGGMFVVDSRGDLCGIVTWSSLSGDISEQGLGRLAARCLFPGVLKSRAGGDVQQ